MTPKRICKFSGCNGPHKGYGWCKKHYVRWKKYGNPAGPPPVPDLPGEHWLPVVDWEGLYEVSDFGRVKSLWRLDTNGHEHPERLIGAKITARHPYPRVVLACNDRQSLQFVHVLVARAFLGPCPEGQEVRHWDGNPGNSYLENLLYGTHAENMHDKRRHGTDHNVNKTHCPRGHKYTPDNIYTSPGKVGRICRECRHAPFILRGYGSHNRAKTHCPQGHRYDEANTYIRPGGKRDCRACMREYQRRRREGVGRQAKAVEPAASNPDSSRVKISASKL